MELSWDIERDGDVSLVRCRVRNDDAVPRRVRIESRLDGPVLPPRRDGVPETGWDEAGVTLRLAPEERRALGFAVRAPPTDPPVEVAEVTAVEPGDEPERSETPTVVALRRLGDHRPPGEAVTGGADAADAAPGTDEPEPDPADSEPSVGEADGWAEAVEARLDAVESRIDRAERLTDADLAAATAALAEADGVEELSALDDRVAADAERLRELTDRASALAARAESTDAPVEALERLA